MDAVFFDLTSMENIEAGESLPSFSCELERQRKIAQRVAETLQEKEPGHQLLTPELLGALLSNQDAERLPNPTFYAKYFTAWNGENFFVCSYDPQTGDFYGIRGVEEITWGHFSLDELMSLRGPFEMKIERSLSFFPTAASEVVE